MRSITQNYETTHFWTGGKNYIAIHNEEIQLRRSIIVS